MFKKGISFIVISSLIFMSCGKEEEEQVKIIGEHVSEKTYLEKNPIKKVVIEEITEEQKKKNLENKNRVKSYLRTFCGVYNDVYDFTNSRHFKILKQKVDEIESDNSNFLYLDLPSLVYGDCKKEENNYLETVILYLQTDSENLVDLKSKIDKNELENYIKKLSLVDGDIPKNIKEKSVFNNFFLNKQVEELNGFIYPYYVKERKNISSFLAKPIFTIENDNKNKEISLRKIDKDLKELGFKEGLVEFKKLLLINNNYNSVNDLKKEIKKDYNNFIKDKEDLEKKLSNLPKFKTYIKTNKYKELLENNNTKKQIEEIGKKMLIFSIIGNDYADGLNETWAGEQFFGDEKVGNSIIRLNFIYILSL